MAPESVEDLAEVRRLVLSGEARRTREAARITKSELAREVGVSHAAICRWEAADRMPRGDTAIAYLRCLRRLARVAGER